MVRRGIILLVVGARLKQLKGLLHLCVRSAERLRLTVLQSKIYTYFWSDKLSASLLMFVCHRYLTKLSVYDKNDHASFVLLGDAGFELTGKKASALVESYFEVITNMTILSFCVVFLQVFTFVLGQRKRWR